MVKFYRNKKSVKTACDSQVMMQRKFGFCWHEMLRNSSSGIEQQKTLLSLCLSLMFLLNNYTVFVMNNRSFKLQVVVVRTFCLFRQFRTEPLNRNGSSPCRGSSFFFFRGAAWPLMTFHGAQSLRNDAHRQSETSLRANAAWFSVWKYFSEANSPERKSSLTFKEVIHSFAAPQSLCLEC